LQAVRCWLDFFCTFVKFIFKTISLLLLFMLLLSLSLLLLLILSLCDSLLLPPGLSRGQILEKYAAYASEQERLHGPKIVKMVAKPITSLFSGMHMGKQFRRNIDGFLNISSTSGSAPTKEGKSKRGKSSAASSTFVVGTGGLRSGMTLGDILLKSAECLPSDIWDATTPDRKSRFSYGDSIQLRKEGENDEEGEGRDACKDSSCGATEMGIKQ
jgi:hypothetical protein